MFAKLFGPPDDQVLVTLLESDETDDALALTVWAKPPSPMLSVCQKRTESLPGPKARAAFRKVFDELTEEQARDMARSIYELAAGFRGR